MQTFDGIEHLTPPELRAFFLLKKINSNSIWSVAINDVVQSPSVHRFRRLLADLRSQANDNSEMMKVILGDAYHAVIQL